MASEQDDVVYTHNDDEESSETDGDPEENDDEIEDPEEEDLNSPSTSSPMAVSAVTVTTTATPALSAIATSSVTVALPATPAITVAAIPFNSDPERLRMTEIVPKPPIDESRRLFQRLWTDEDEIELLRGFLDYTTSNRGGGNSHHHDTAAFYEQIKSKLQLDFNKNQLVEKLRRLKKKYRNAVNKINSGKDISFKTPHEQVTFEISRKIWSDSGKIIGFEDNVLDDDENHNHNNINNITTSTSGNFNPSQCSNPNFEVKIEDGVEKKMGNSISNRSRKRSRSKIEKTEEEKRCASDGFGSNINNHENSGGGCNDGNHSGGGGGGGNVAAAVEETLKGCLSPLLREFTNGTTAAMAMMIGGNPSSGSRGIGLWPRMASAPSVLPPLPSHFPAFGFGGMLGLSNISSHVHGHGNNSGGAGGGGGGGVGELVNEKWRKQQILELEVYSRRLELLQDQIRLALAELRAMGGGGGG